MVGLEQMHQVENRCAVQIIAFMIFLEGFRIECGCNNLQVATGIYIV